jgi:hypothetical protein
VQSADWNSSTEIQWMKIRSLYLIKIAFIILLFENMSIDNHLPEEAPYPR